MRFALSDLKKTILRRGGEPRLVPYLLRPGELTDALERLIALYEAWEGRERAIFPEDRPAELIGDYRLARCLGMCLSEWYEWRSPAWPGPASAELAAALAARGVTSASALRLALYDYVNAAAGGYLPEGKRETQLRAFAASLGIPRPILDVLLALDSDAEAILQRLAPTSPTAAELATRYNQRAVEALLANAATVEWRVPPGAAEDAGGGLGTVVKRICFLARQMGVQYEVAFDEESDGGDDGEERTPDAEDEPAAARLVAERPAPYRAPAAGTALTPEIPELPDAPELLDMRGRAVRITLYGPQELMGAPNQYGERLARLCRALLGYRRRIEGAGGRGAALSGGGIAGAASVYLHGRPLRFTLDDRLLRLLRAETADAEATEHPPVLGAAPGGAARDSTDAADFDSALEARLHADFVALERADEAHGWRIEREPEPLLVGDTILVPDFALTRGPRRVYLEIAGYWRPEYRERKARKLAALRGRADLILAAPETARAEFAALAAHFPLLWYTEQVSARALLATLDRAYDDFARRLGALRIADVCAEVEARGHIAPLEARALLRCHTRNELAEAVRRVRDGAGAVGVAAPAWVEGVGLCGRGWLEGLLGRLRALVAAAPSGRLAVSALCARLTDELPGVTPPVAETLARLAGLGLVRASIFEAEVTLDPAVAEPTSPPSSAAARTPQPRRGARRTSRVAPYATRPFALPEYPEHMADDEGDEATPGEATEARKE